LISGVDRNFATVLSIPQQRSGRAHGPRDFVKHSCYSSPWLCAPLDRFLDIFLIISRPKPVKPDIIPDSAALRFWSFGYCAPLCVRTAHWTNCGGTSSSGPNLSTVLPSFGQTRVR
jgi:hypothetical protein